MSAKGGRPKAGAGKSSRRRQPQYDLVTDEVPLDYLGLPGLRTLPPVEENEFSVWVKAEQFPKLASCPECGCADKGQWIKNGTRLQIFLHEPRGFRRQYVKLHRQSYSCKRCKSAPQHPLPALSDRWWASHDLIGYVEKETLLCPQRRVALRTGLSTKIIREIAVANWDHLDATVRFETPRVLGLDGVFARVKVEEDGNTEQGGETAAAPDNERKDAKKKTVKRECLMVTDIEKGIAIELRPSATKEYVVEFLRNLPDKQNIRIVVIDMSPVLLSAVKEALPWAIIVIDLFHVLSKANLGMDNVRIRLRKKTRRVKGQPTMCAKELLRKHRNPSKPTKVPPGLKPWFEIFPELGQAYGVKESCFELQYSSSRRTALRRLRRWLERFPLELRKDFAELLRALRDREEEILNYFDHPFTNAFTEERNRLVKDILRETRGCSFQTLRARVLYGSRLKRQMEEALREEMARKKKRKPRAEGSEKPEAQGSKKRRSRSRKGRAEKGVGAEVAAAPYGAPWQPPSPQLCLF